MPKFSIIVPVYNVEEYLEKCLDSIFNQTFKDFEVIVVNDGSTDNSGKIIEKYNVIPIIQSNKGLSEARNTGVKKATGEYLLFIDSDDYIDDKLLENINKSLSNNPDLVRYQIREVFDDRVVDYTEKEFTGLSGEEAFNTICGYHFVENAWSYVYKKEYYKNNNFKFAKGMVHEDFGIVPLIIMKANTVNSISYVGYNYVQRSGSIMNSNNYQKIKKKVNDFYSHYNFLISEIDKYNVNSTYFKSFISNSMIKKICELNKEDYKYYFNKLKKEKVFDSLLTDSFGRKLKKKIVAFSPKLYYKLKG